MTQDIRVLAFTASCHRPLMLRHCLLQIQNQTFPVDHAVYVNSSESELKAYTTLNYRKLIDDIVSCAKNRIFVGYGPSDLQAVNFKAALKLAPLTEYDLFLKVDDDDIYLHDYVKEVVEDFRKRRWDLSGTSATGQLNGYRWKPDAVMKDLGQASIDRELGIPTFMPSSAAYSRAAIEDIMQSAEGPGADDQVFNRHLGMKGNYKLMFREGKNFVYNIHGKNKSTFMYLET